MEFTSYLTCFILLLLLLEQILYIVKKGSILGPSLVLPFLGPTKFPPLISRLKPSPPTPRSSRLSSLTTSSHGSVKLKPKAPILFRSASWLTSQTVFMGPYMGLKAQERFERDYFLFNMGLMKLSFDFLGIALRNARLAVDRLVGALGTCTKMSKTRM
ncbi:hypothetical protein JHK82_044354 [Glycine max]|nr:hypothetical protein JHK86_044702 [Glycine max]KAG4951446.1 hypothetical protein JHK85_045313 [Glycine max]KAG5099302.1 hypothetical protein JHK82_044354 [Glycine max]